MSKTIYCINKTIKNYLPRLARKFDRIMQIISELLYCLSIIVSLTNMEFTFFDQIFDEYEAISVQLSILLKHR